MNNTEFSQLWGSLWLYRLAVWFDSVAKPGLAGLAIISAGTAVIGFASQFDNPDLGIYLRCTAIGFALWLIARTFWAGAWMLPAFETKQPLLIYAGVTAVGFLMFATVSVLGSLSATGGDISRGLTQKQTINQLESRGQQFVLYVGEIAVPQASLLDRAEQAFDFERAEIAGQGPTGVPGTGSVSNSFGASGRAYVQAAQLLGTTLTHAEGNVVNFESAIADARAVQIDASLSSSERDAQLQTLAGRAISEMRALLALNPARSIRAAATKIAQGVPQQSRANTQSQARLDEISASMRAFARVLDGEADRITALTPELPEQTSLSPAERLIQTMWRMPGFTMAAILLDACGFIAIGFRIAIYRTLKVKIEEENARPVPAYVTLEDFWRVEEFVKRAEEAKKAIESAKGTAKRGRPRVTQQKALPKAASPKASNTNRKPVKRGGVSNG
ncbi:hypothetical protein [Roseobacter sp. MH60115]|uniref:hypothetical protein n=1 Tax=Roseobacter sp. MH60115 TaxID=2785324 RepID=UPI0018A2AE8E|nr:hypothetical protein [Roseobacter sp. MH60115]